MRKRRGWRWKCGSENGLAVSLAVEDQKTPMARIGALVWEERCGPKTARADLCVSASLKRLLSRGGLDLSYPQAGSPLTEAARGG